METPSFPRRHMLRWLIPALLVLTWLVVGGVGGPFAGKLTQVQSNDAVAFLPASAEATKVSQLQQKFSDSQLIPAVVVADRQAGITPQDMDYLAGLAQSAAQFEGISDQISPPIPSQDGKAVQVFVGVDSTVDPGKAVDELRDLIAADAPGGLQVLVAGPAGQVADLSEAFAGIDGLLLLVAGGVVALILVGVYRSPLLPVLVLLSAVFALSLASAVTYLLASNGAIALNGQSQGILFILVFGAATDYALLLVARFREELSHDADRFAAIVRAWKGVAEPIAASAGTVILGVLCLLFSDLNSNRGLGPVAAIGIAASLIASLTFLPAALALTGRAAFWPTHPDAAKQSETGLWWRIARTVDMHHTKVWIGTALLLVVCASVAPQLKASGIAQSDFFLTQVDSATGQQILGEHFPGGSGSPVVIFADADSAAQVIEAVAAVPGVSAGVTTVGDSGAAGGPPRVVDGLVQIHATLNTAADSETSVNTVKDIRSAVRAVPGADALVGGTTAIQLDTQTTSQRDRNVIIPMVLLVVFAILALLMRALVAPLLLLGTVVLSFTATLGVSALVFNHVFDFPGADPVVPLYGFVFLVALGVDYNIFLMTRVREESRKYGTREGVRRGLAVTGGVITSAGLVLAATFGALAVIPLIFLAQIAFIVAFGVLLDTLVVRSLLVPALTVQIGRKVWWPSALARGKR